MKDKNQIFERDFDGAFRENRPTFFYTALKITGNYHDAEEAVQNACLKLLQALAARRKDVIENAMAYLQQSTFHAAIDIRRQTQRFEGMHVPREQCKQIAVPGVLEVDQRIEYVQAALAKMKPKLAQTLILCEVNEMSCSEIAKKLDRPLGTVLSDYYRAKFQARRLIRIEEKHHEAQKTKHQGLPKPGLPNASGA